MPEAYWMQSVCNCEMQNLLQRERDHPVLLEREQIRLTQSRVLHAERALSGAI